MTNAGAAMMTNTYLMDLLACVSLAKSTTASAKALPTFPEQFQQWGHAFVDQGT